MFLWKPLSLLNIKFPIFINPAVARQANKANATEYKEKQKSDKMEIYYLFEFGAN